jgi:HlyD family secretion protein
MKKLVTILIILALAGGGAYYYYAYGRTTEKPTIVQASVSRGEITEAVSATGTLEALRTVQVGSQVSGTVSDLHGVDFNSIVKKDQIIASLDPSLLQVQVDIQKANIERQEVDIENQNIQLEDAKRQAARTQEQFDKQLVSAQVNEQAVLNVKTRVASIASSEKMLVQARANLAQAELNVDYCTIKSPIDGVVVSRSVDVGQTVQSSMNVATFFVIATDLTNLKLTAGVDEADIGKIRPNMEVNFSVDSYPQQTFRGTVNAVRLNATTTNNVVTYPVWIDVPNPDLKLRPSMTAQVKIVVQTVANVVRVPNQGLRFRPTADIYAALGLQAPTPGQGRGNRQNAGGQGAAGQPGAASRGSQATGDSSAKSADPNAPATTGQDAKPGQDAKATTPDSKNAQAQPGQNPADSGNQGRRQGGRGGGGFGNNANLTPEQRQAMADRYGRQGGAGRGGRNGNRQQQPAANDSTRTTSIMDTKADKIDELYEPMPAQISPGQVWTWDEDKKELKQTNIRVGLTDGQFSELLNGDLQVGQQIVTGVILPITARPANNSTNPLMGPQRGGQPGFGPGAPGGGGGGGRGGGGGGGRGGI